MSETTLVIIKPDVVEAGNVGKVLARYEEAGLSIVAMDLRTIDGEFADRHYEEHLERDFYPNLRTFMTSGPMVPLVLRGEGSVARVRELNGATDPTKADPGTIRADFGESGPRNAVHASDSTESAAREIALWFPGL
ncbi:nucleoside-diphosphate kinase [Tessaracoccus lubricantis]|uniref:Nucleoside diphosphate kinase n=1 Tax=Tessaracoccus lubricantis TaxID=545543 RepID=A0ABP9FKF5_9ACTN